MGYLKEAQSKPAEEPKEKLAVILSPFCVVTDEPDEFIEKLDQLCQEYCDHVGDYYFRYECDGTV